jgi:uncharacterized membrane protein
VNSKTWTHIIALILLATLVIPVQLAAQNAAKLHHPHQHRHYQLVDVGTFGGPQSWMFSPGAARAGLLNNQEELAGSADTLALDPYCFWSPDCYATHAFQWQNGRKTDLGVLSGGIGSLINWISANGLMAGISDNGQQDPLNPALPQVRAILWKHGELTDLGTLPADGYDTWATAVNNRSEVAGQAYNTIPDPNSLFGYGYQSRAFYWENGVMQDLGTLGTGTEAMAGLINERGQVVGWSYTSAIANPTCASISSFSLTTGSFLWDSKSGMKDIGGLGGTCTLANDLNNWGQIVGGSSLTDETTVHPFVWNAATGVVDLLDPSDGSYGFAEGENAHGEVAGGTCDDVTCYAVLWRKNGRHWQRTNLSTVTQAAFAVSINSSGQVVGNWSGGAFLSEDGGPMVDLSTLVSPGSGMLFSEAHQINDRGEIAIGALDANGNNRAVLLIPCDENHPGVDGCDYNLVDAATAAPVGPVPAIPNPSALTPPTRMPGMLNRSRGVRQTPGFRPQVPDARQALSVNTATNDLDADHRLAPETAGRHVGYCIARSNGLTGYCSAYNYYSCLAKPSPACPSGQKAKDPGYFRCSNTHQTFVDLGRSCGF